MIREPGEKQIDFPWYNSYQLNDFPSQHLQHIKFCIQNVLSLNFPHHAPVFAVSLKHFHFGAHKREHRTYESWITTTMPALHNFCGNVIFPTNELCCMCRLNLKHLPFENSNLMLLRTSSLASILHLLRSGFWYFCMFASTLPSLHLISLDV